MKYIEALTTYNGNKKSLFLAGGITNCPDWQTVVAEWLKYEDIVLLNPRRKKFPINNPDAARKQIIWEYKHLRTASAILFWFPEETICPIVLYELGAWSMTGKPLFVGIHPNYLRKRDVEIQTKLVRPDIQITNSLPHLINQVVAWVEE